MYPDREKAKQLLEEAVRRNPGPWERHSELVAECAERIASRCGLDTEKAYVCGLLHDIGRRFGKGHFRHIVDGWDYMQSLGYEEAARICLTHSFHTGTVQGYIGNFDVPPERVEEMERFLSEREFDEYDKLIQLCDSMASDRILDLEERMADVERRYGAYPQEKKEKIWELKAHFEELCGEGIYQMVEGVGQYGETV